jgi:simple sugar transport system permease protein/ribose transport system permease protein
MSAPVIRDAPAAAPSWPGLLRRTNVQLVLLLVVLFVAFSLSVDRFFSTESFWSMGIQVSGLGILSLAMMITLLKGGINLSIIATANLCSLTMAYVMGQLTPPGTEGAALAFGLVVALGAGALVAAVIGALNGYIIAYLGVSPILATLGTMTLVKGIAVGLTAGDVLSGFPAIITFIGNGAVFGVPFSLFVFIACAIPVAIWLSHTPTGMFVYMIGSNEQATRYSGVDTKRVVFKVYVYSSLLAWLGAIVLMGWLNSARADYSESYLLVTILAAVLGGIDPFGGAGKVIGLVLALAILQVISSAFNLLGFSPFLTLAIWGVILVAAAAVAIVTRQGRRS